MCFHTHKHIAWCVNIGFVLGLYAMLRIHYWLDFLPHGFSEQVMWRLVYSLLTAGQTLLSTAVLTLLLALDMNKAVEH